MLRGLKRHVFTWAKYLAIFCFLQLLINMPSYLSRPRAEQMPAAAENVVSRDIGAVAAISGYPPANLPLGDNTGIAPLPAYVGEQQIAPVQQQPEMVQPGAEQGASVETTGPSWSASEAGGAAGAAGAAGTAGVGGAVGGPAPVTRSPLPYAYDSPAFLTPPLVPMDPPPRRILYNRVGKTGSSGVINVLRTQSRTYDFNLVSSEIFGIRRFTDAEQRELAREISEMPTPLVFERHFHFFNHSQFGYEDPVYINVVREPLERLVSAYYFRRANVHNKHNLRSELNKQMPYDDCVRLRMMCTDNRTTFRVIPFFCGQHDFCQEPTYDSLNQAKANVERFYPLVGITDDLDSFFMVAEKLMPFYFKGAAEIFRFQQDALHRRFGTREKRPMSNDTIAYMKPRLTLEYDFYNWLVQRFEQQKAAFLS